MLKQSTCKPWLEAGGIKSTIQNSLSPYAATEVKTAVAGNFETPNKPATYYASRFRMPERPDSLR